MLPAKTQENFTGRYLERLKNQNGEHHVNLSEWNNVEPHFIFPRVN